MDFLTLLSDIGLALLSREVLGVFLLFLGMWGIIRVVNDADNDIAWWHFFATRSKDGKTYGDITKIGILVGIVASTFIVVSLGEKDELDWTVFGIWLVFISGSESFSKWVKTFIETKYNVKLGKDGKPELEGGKEPAKAEEKK